MGINITLDLLYARGMIGEYVYDNNNETSRLQWDIDPVIYIGSVLNISFFNRLTFGAGYWSGVNRKTGDMTDTDWSDSGIETRQSHHQCNIQKAEIIDINITAGIVDFSSAMFFVHAGYKWQNTAIEAGDGYVEGTGNDSNIALSGKFVNYEQRFSLPYAGFSLYIPLTRNLYFKPFFSISPFVSCTVQDRHISTGLNYYDSFENGWYFYTGMTLGYKWERVNMNIHIGYTRIPEFRGDTYTINKFSGTRTKTFKDSAGTEFHSCEIGISIGTSFEL